MMVLKLMGEIRYFSVHDAFAGIAPCAGGLRPFRASTCRFCEACSLCLLGKCTPSGHLLFELLLEALKLGTKFLLQGKISSSGGKLCCYF